jgi:ELWxxDGT repeat protein
MTRTSRHTRFGADYRCRLHVEPLEQRRLLSATPQLLKDISFPSTAGPFGLLAIGGSVFFANDDGTHGYELWRSDVATGDTVLVKDINPDSASAFPYGVSLTKVNGTVFFLANDGTTGLELWKSDGTAAGTMLVRDINPAGNSFPIGLTNVNGTLFFAANDGTNGQELWKSDGTTAGTVLVQDIYPGAFSASPRELTNVNGTLFFAADDGTNGFELWKSPDNPTAPVLVKDIFPGSSFSDPSSLTNVNGTLFFSANDGANGRELWRSDGTIAGTVLLSDINSGASDSTPTYLTNVNGTLFFQANDGSHGQELWKSDGTTTMLVKDIHPGASGSQAGFFRQMTNVNGTLFFPADDGTNGFELWKSDGTAAGTVLVKDINPGGFHGLSGLLYGIQANVNGTLFFSANDGTHGFELWKSDGTAPGTVLVKDIRPGSNDGLSGIAYLTNVNGTLFFRANDGTNGDKLWKSNGTTAGTVIVPGNSTPSMFTEVGGIAFFRANDGTQGYELWKSDGTTAGTVLLKDINPGAGTSLPSVSTFAPSAFAVNVNGTLFFAANDGTTGYELWKSDGTTAGTVLVKDIKATGSSLPKWLTNVNGTLFFAANDGTSGAELWKSDGTTAGTVLVKDIRPGSGSSVYEEQYPLTNLNGTLFLAANDGTSGAELWKSDGTTAGTVLVKDINPGSGGSFTANYLNIFTNVNGTLFFPASGLTGPRDLWKSDGTTAGTVLVKDLNGLFLTFLRFHVNVNGTLFFGAFDATSGNELWKSDGTTAGTVVVKDINPGSNDSRPYYLTNVNGTLFFSAVDGTTGRELWKSDGTTAGTVLVKDINPGGDALPHNFYGVPTNVSGTLFFSANDGTTGQELWTSDGTAAGTVIVQDIKAGSSGSLPNFLTNVNGKLFFAADDGAHGVEPWVLQVASTVSGTKLFYKGSTKWNVTNGATFSDDNAIAPDKTAYLPGGGTSAFSAVSSYSLGINGLMVDISGPHGALTASDFIFKVGNNNSPSTWATATGPTAVTTRAAAGTGGSDRVELLWANNAIQKQWLEVVVKGNDTLGGSNTNTGLASSYVFYFGNALGDAGVADAAAFSVTSSDEINARNNPKTFTATRSDVNDFNRDGSVNSSDQIIARNNTTSLGNQLKFLVVGAGGPFVPDSSSVVSSNASPTIAADAAPATATIGDASATRGGDLGVSSGVALNSSVGSGAALSGPPPWPFTDLHNIDPRDQVFRQFATASSLPDSQGPAAADDNSDDSVIDDELLDSLLVGFGTKNPRR